MCKMLCNRQDKEIQLTKEWLFYSTDSCNFHEDLNCRRSIEEISNPRKESFCRRSEIVSLLSIVLFCPEYLNYFFLEILNDSTVLQPSPDIYQSRPLEDVPPEC